MKLVLRWYLSGFYKKPKVRGGLWEGQGLKQGLSAHHEWDQHFPPWPRRNPALPTMAPDPDR